VVTFAVPREVRVVGVAAVDHGLADLRPVPHALEPVMRNPGPVEPVTGNPAPGEGSLQRVRGPRLVHEGPLPSSSGTQQQTRPGASPHRRGPGHPGA
jgi:hypothetical protein